MVLEDNKSSGSAEGSCEQIQDYFPHYEGFQDDLEKLAPLSSQSQTPAFHGLKVDTNIAPSSGGNEREPCELTPSDLSEACASQDSACTYNGNTVNINQHSAHSNNDNECVCRVGTDFKQCNSDIGPDLDSTDRADGNIIPCNDDIVQAHAKTRHTNTNIKQCDAHVSQEIANIKQCDTHISQENPDITNDDAHIIQENANASKDIATDGSLDAACTEQTILLSEIDKDSSNEKLGNEVQDTKGDSVAEHAIEEPLMNDTKEIHLDDALSATKFGKFQLTILILTCGAYFSACSQMMQVVFLSKPIKAEWSLGTMAFPILPFCCGVMSLIGSYLFGTLSDRIGRRKPFFASIVFMAVFGMMAAAVPYFWMFVVVKALVSFGTSGIEAINFVLLLEFLPRKNRGRLMVVVTLCGVFGAVFTASLAWLVLPRYGWRWFVGCCSVPSMLLICYGLVIRYESPRYLFISNQSAAGEKVLQKIAKKNGTQLPSGKIVCPPSEERGRIQDLFSPQLRWQTICASFVWFMQSMGYWSVTMYLPEYMASINFNPYLNTFSVFMAEIPGMLLAIFLVEPERLGRIRSLRVFSFITVGSLLIFAFLNVAILKTISAMVVYCFMVPIYSILNTVTPELYPTDMRSMAMAWVYMLISLPGLIIPFLGASVLSTNIPWLYPLVAAGFFLLQFVFTFGLRTETAGKALNDTKSSVRNHRSDRTGS